MKRPAYRYWTEEARSQKGQDGAGELARQLKEQVTEQAPELGASLYSDLLSAALSDVDWYEIAESYLDDCDPEPDHDRTDDDDTRLFDGDVRADFRYPGDDEELDRLENSCNGSAMPEPTPEPQADLTELFGEVIHRYTRAQALADGVLVDVSETAKEAGFAVPVALTQAVWAQYVAVPEGVECQDEAGRLWDVLWMSRHGIIKAQANASERLFQLHVRNDNRRGTPPLVTLKAVCGPDDEARPCITILMPDED